MIGLWNWIMHTGRFLIPLNWSADFFRSLCCQSLSCWLRKMSINVMCANVDVVSNSSCFPSSCSASFSRKNNEQSSINCHIFIWSSFTNAFLSLFLSFFIVNMTSRLSSKKQFQVQKYQTHPPFHPCETVTLGNKGPWLAVTKWRHRRRK